MVLAEVAATQSNICWPVISKEWNSFVLIQMLKPYLSQQPPNVYDAEPIPAAAMAEVERLLSSGDLFRYTASGDAPVTLLEQEFAAQTGARFCC